MAFYWASFKERNGKLYRFDTRIYLNDIIRPSKSDRCIGAIVGKNPGSAEPSSLSMNILEEINLNGDKLLPTARNIFLKTGIKIPQNQYVQVLNLFYLRNPDLNDAIKENEEANSMEICLCESNKFPWVWFVWGGKNKSLDKYKDRFHAIKATRKFYFDNYEKKVVEGFPNNSTLAKHTQGLKHDYIVPYFKKILNNIV